MPGKIFYRERSKVREGNHQPRFHLVAVAGLDLKLHAQHMRKAELEQIAKELNAELILLARPEKGEEDDDLEVS